MTKATGPARAFVMCVVAGGDIIGYVLRNFRDGGSFTTLDPAEAWSCDNQLDGNRFAGQVEQYRGLGDGVTLKMVPRGQCFSFDYLRNN